MSQLNAKGVPSPRGGTWAATAVYGCATNKDRGTAVCPNEIKVQRKVIEQVLLAGIKADLLSEAAYRAFEDEAHRLLKEVRPDPGEAKRMVARAKAEVDNLLATIRQGIITPSTKKALEEAETRLQDAERRAREVQSFQPAQMLPRAREIHRSMVERLECIEDVAAARAAISAIVGEVQLVPENGELWAEMTNAGMAGACQISVVSYENDTIICVSLVLKWVFYVLFNEIKAII